MLPCPHYIVVNLLFTRHNVPLPVGDDMLMLGWDEECLRRVLDVEGGESSSPYDVSDENNGCAHGRGVEFNLSEGFSFMCLLKWLDVYFGV